jgi:hypothetical protein
MSERRVADDEYIIHIWWFEVWPDAHPAGAIAVQAQPGGGRRSLDARGPDDCCGRHALVSQRNTVGVALGHRTAQPDVDAEARKRLRGIA